MLEILSNGVEFSAKIKKPASRLFSRFTDFFGAVKQIRTADLFLTKEVLCRLSYNSTAWGISRK